MTVVRPLPGTFVRHAILLGALGGVLVGVVVAPLGVLAGPFAHSSDGPSPPMLSAPRGTAVLQPEFATLIGELGRAPSEGVVGTPIAFAWQALGPSGSRVASFAVACDLTVVATANSSSVLAWVNASTEGALVRSTDGTVTVPAIAWNGGVLNLTVSVASAVPVTVRLFGAALPSLPDPVSLAVLPDLFHLVLYSPLTNNSSHPGERTNVTFWHVRDRFGDPTPGAYLVVEIANATTLTRTFEPVNWTTGGMTGAWVHYSVSTSENATVRIMDRSGAMLLGPISLPALSTSVAPATAELSPILLALVALLAVGAVAGMATLIFGGRPRPSPGSADGEEELRELAEGRETIVALVRAAGSLGLAEIEASWSPHPSPPALADWIASLVTDGTLTATLEESGRACFALAEHPVEGPKVTLDPAALELGIARRDAAVGDEDDRTT